MKFTYNDGGRAAAGYKGSADDCVTRAIAIASMRPYQEIYDAINEVARGEKLGPRFRGTSSARTGVHKPTSKDFLRAHGWRWTPTMHIGSGCRVHLTDGELPMGRLVVQVSRHMVAVIDGVINDTHDPQRDGTRCVYGYWGRA